jgi:hypothetical protein
LLGILKYLSYKGKAPLFCSKTIPVNSIKINRKLVFSIGDQVEAFSFILYKLKKSKLMMKSFYQEYNLLFIHSFIFIFSLSAKSLLNNHAMAKLHIMINSNQNTKLFSRSLFIIMSVFSHW